MPEAPRLPGGQLVSFALGELDSTSQTSLEKRVDTDPALREELEEIRAHIRIHQQLRKVAPRRGSFERLHLRMKKDGAFSGAIPGVHCMLRRSFLLAMIVAAIAIASLLVFSVGDRNLASPDVIGEILQRATYASGDARGDSFRDQLEKQKEYKTGEYEAYIWLPTGVNNTSSTLEALPNTAFQFQAARSMKLNAGALRRMDIRPGGVGEGSFTVVTPHCRVEIDEGSLSVKLTPDGLQTLITVGSGSARVYGQDAERGVPVTAGYCTSVERGKLPSPARPVLKLTLSKVTGTEYMIDATLKNDGYEEVRISRAVDQTSRFPDPIYVLHISYASEYIPGVTPENATLPPWPVTPMDAANRDHAGEKLLAPGSAYRFRFDISPLLVSTPAVDHWLRLEYRGDLYGPPGQARVKLQSDNLKLDLRTR